jgi:hypothetical protein
MNWLKAFWKKHWGIIIAAICALVVAKYILPMFFE